MVNSEGWKNQNVLAAALNLLPQFAAWEWSHAYGAVIYPARHSIGSGQILADMDMCHSLSGTRLLSSTEQPKKF